MTWRSGLVLRRPRTFERLEDRLMLTTLVVNNPTDTAVAAELSLRQAVAQANLDAAAGTSDTITFDSSLGSQTITLTKVNWNSAAPGPARSRSTAAALARR